ncbi:MAG: hypothetical protein Q8R16_00175, partial [bacterium]|nr:hypothetical protein [bacterium]
NHKILRYAVIRNVVNEMFLIIGLDCLGKLVAFLERGRIEAPLRNGTSNRARFHALLDALRHDIAGGDTVRGAILSNKTVLGWFEAEQEAGRLPEDIARLVRLTLLDVLPTPADAERLVEHYRRHRLLPIEVLIPAGQLRFLARFRRHLPALIPIAAAPRVLRLASRAARVADANRQWRELAVRRAWLTERLSNFRHRRLLPTSIPDAMIERVERCIERDRPITAFLRLPAALAGLDELLAQLCREIPGSDWYLRNDVEKLRLEIVTAASQPPNSTHEYLLRRVGEWERVVRRQLESPIVRVYVDPKIAIPIIFSQDEDSAWQHQRWFLRAEQRPARAGVYTARLVSGHDLFALAETPGPEPRTATMTLDIALDTSPFCGTYRGHGGRDGDRWIIPVPRPLWRPGTYRCLILRERANQVFVYPIARERARRRKSAP